MKDIEITWWKTEDFFLGYLNDYPDYETQGKTLEELKENLKDLWEDLSEEKIPYQRKRDFLNVA